MRTAFNPIGNIDMAKDYIIDYGSNSNSWYRKWKSGWLEQGGTNFNPTFMKSFSNTNYTIIITTTMGWGYVASINAKTTNGCTFHQWQSASGGNFSNSLLWYACGF